MSVWYQHLELPFWQTGIILVRIHLWDQEEFSCAGANQCHKEPHPAGCSIRSLYFTNWVLTFKTRDKNNCHIIFRTLEKGIHLAQFQVTPQVGHPEQPREGGAGISRILHCSISQNNFSWWNNKPFPAQTTAQEPATASYLHQQTWPTWNWISSTLNIPQAPARSQIIWCCNSSVRHQPAQRFASQLPLDSKICFSYCKHYSSHRTRLLLLIPQVTLLKLCFGWGSTITLPAAGNLCRVCCDPGMEEDILQGQAMEGVMLQELGN